MLKLYFGNRIAKISTLLLVMNLVMMVLGCIYYSFIQTWGIFLLGLIILNGVFWYFANVRDLYSNSIVNAIDGSKEKGLFSANSIQSIVYWCTSIIIWFTGIMAVFKLEGRQFMFYLITAAALIQIICIEGSRIQLYRTCPDCFDYM